MGGKRASSSPASERPSKRLALSSPEEGELDDKTTTPDDRPPSPAQRFHNSRVPFPFKKAGARSPSPSRSRSPPRHRLPARVDSPREEDCKHDRYRPLPPPPRRGHDRYVPAYEHRRGGDERHEERIDSRRGFRDHRDPYDSRLRDDTRRDAHPVVYNNYVPVDNRREYDSYRPEYTEVYESRKDGYDNRRDHRRRSPQQYRMQPSSQAPLSPPRLSPHGVAFSPPSLPPPPSSLPPPPPPVVTPPLPQDILPNQREGVKFSIARRGDEDLRPRPDSQYPPTSKRTGQDWPKPPADPVRQANGHDSRGSSEVPRRVQDKASSTTPRQDSPKKPRRPPVKRTVSRERCAYDRVFVGCGRMDAYDVTTKVGEGTFG